MSQITPEDIRNPARVSGFNYVKRSSYASKARPFQAQKFGGPATPGSGRGSNLIWCGTYRATALEAAQDYCDYVNSTPSVAPTPALKSAGHNYTAPKIARDPEVEAALGVLRDARAQREGKQGYVYLIIEDLPGGGIHYGKIGYSTNPHKRVAELQTGNPRPLRLLHYKKGTEADEQRLHQKYMKNNKLQEWFFVTKDMLLEFPVNPPAALQRAA